MKAALSKLLPAVERRLDSAEKNLRALAEGEAPEGYGIVY
jgi:hypothetical protein